MAKKDRTGNRKTRDQRRNTRVPELGYYLIVTDTEGTESCYKLRCKTHRLACGMKAAFLCKTTFLLLDIYIDWIYSLCI